MIPAANHPRSSQFAVDKLPETKRQQVINAIIEGKSLREVAVLAGVAHTAIARYKRRVVIPAIRQSQKIAAFEQVTGSVAEQTQAVAKNTRDIIASSPFRARIEYLWGIADRSLTKAEDAAKRYAPDKDGEMRAIGSDLTPIAPLLAQAHKNVELLGRATGELEQAAGPQIAVQIVIPASQGPPGTSSPTADVSCSLRGTG